MDYALSTATDTFGRVTCRIDFTTPAPHYSPRIDKAVKAAQRAIRATVDTLVSQRDYRLRYTETDNELTVTGDGYTSITIREGR